jgi:tRNA (adenine57-N1/adenine58-N1)-methyltransferase
MSAPFEPGERIMLLDSRGRRYLIRLVAGGEFHYHAGVVPHALIIGREEGSSIQSTKGAGLICLRPRLADFVLKMPRGAQVIYPKDLGAILMYADVAPGTRVLEAGTGSAALTMAAARATGPEGAVVSYELREDHHSKAVDNLETFFGKVPDWVDLRLGDVAQVATTGERFDRLLLDLPEPWGVLDTAGLALDPGGILCAYLPTANQVQELVEGLTRRRFGQVETFEIMLRTWHVTPRSVRPDHRMIGHTGFITIARSGLGQIPSEPEQPAVYEGEPPGLL